jgi:hypothetical protein
MPKSQTVARTRKPAVRSDKGEQVLDKLLNVASATNTIVGGFGKIAGSLVTKSFPYLLSTGGGILFALVAHIVGLFVPTLADTFIVASSGGLGLITGAISARGLSGIRREASKIGEMTVLAGRYSLLIDAATETGRVIQTLPANTPRYIRDNIWAELAARFVKPVPSLPAPEKRNK